MVQVDRENLEEALVAGSAHGVGCVVGVRPCVRALREALLCCKEKGNASYHGKRVVSIRGDESMSGM